MISKGTITKTLHNGQKVYAVITATISVDGQPYFTVRFPFNGQVVEEFRAKDQCRRPHMPQNSELATVIRQLVGVPFEKPIDIQPTKALVWGEVETSHPDEEPFDEGDEE